jgi:hypothetical protein
MTCPESEVLAAHAEGRLDAAESTALLDHAADCDDCRRQLSLLETGRIPDGPETALPSRIRARVMQTVRPFRPARSFRNPRPSYAALVAAAGVAVAIVLAAVLNPRPEPAVPRAVPAPLPLPLAAAPDVAPLPAPAPPNQVPTIVAVPDPEPEARGPEPVAPPAAPPRVEDAAPPPAAAPPAPRETRAEPATPRASPTHAIAVRALTELRATDFSGPVSIRRRGGASKERPSGFARLSDADILVAEKAAGFHVDGVHPVVLGEGAQVSVAYAAEDRAPWLHVRGGEVLVDSLRPTRWVLTDGRIAVTLRQARARFAAFPGRGLCIAALGDPVYVQPDGGDVHVVRPGEELEVGKSSAELRRADPGQDERRRHAFDNARPRVRTLFHTSCDPTDAKREHFFVEEGSFYRNEALQSKDQADRSSSVVLAPNPRLAWREGLTLRFRFRTNATSLQVSLPVGEKRFAMTANVAVDRRNVGQWVSTEVPFNGIYWRDEGPGMGGFGADAAKSFRFVNTGDKFDSIRFAARQQDVFGDQKVYFLLDDVQVVAGTER